MNIASFANLRPERLIWEDRLWESVPLAGSLNPETKEFGDTNRRDLLANDHYFFMAFGRDRPPPSRPRLALFHGPQRQQRHLSERP